MRPPIKNNKVVQMEHLKHFFKITLIVFTVIILIFPAGAEEKKAKKKAVKKEIEPTRIEFLSEDKQTIVADLYLPLKLKKNIRLPLVVFIHDLAENKKIWQSYARELVEKGYSVLAIDIRGHGESILNKKKQKFYWRSFKEENWKLAKYDVTNAIKTLAKDYPQANTEKMVMIGSSLGACVAVNASEDLKHPLKSLILISPYTTYKGIETRVPLVNYGDHPILIIVSKTDVTSYKAAIELIKYSQGKHELVLVKNAGHGTFMLKFEPKLKDIIYNWIKKELPPTPEEFTVPSSKKEKKEKSTKE